MKGEQKPLATVEKRRKEEEEDRAIIARVLRKKMPGNETQNRYICLIRPISATIEGHQKYKQVKIEMEFWKTYRTDL